MNTNMSEVKRYAIISDNWDYVESPTGGFVDRDDYAVLEAECERLRSERDAFRDSRNYLIEEISSHLSEIAELREVLRSAEIDAARYRWLRSRHVGASFDWDEEGTTVLAFEMPPSLSIGADCDRNIDTAMKGDHQ